MINQPPTDQDALERILRERAILLAREPVSAAANDGKEYLVFTFGAKMLAVEAEYACEATLADDIIPVPGSPAHVLGGFNHRGKMVAILSLPTLLGFSRDQPSDTSAQSPILLLKLSGHEVGLQVSEVIGFKTYAYHEIGGLRGSSLKWVSGMANGGELILDVKQLLETVIHGTGSN